MLIVTAKTRLPSSVLLTPPLVQSRFCCCICCIVVAEICHSLSLSLLAVTPECRVAPPSRSSLSKLKTTSWRKDVLFSPSPFSLSRGRSLERRGEEKGASQSCCSLPPVFLAEKISRISEGKFFSICPDFSFFSLFFFFWRKLPISFICGRKSVIGGRGRQKKLFCGHCLEG